MTFTALPARFPGLRRSALFIALFTTPVVQADVPVLDPLQVSADRGDASEAVISRESMDRNQANDLRDIFADRPDISVGGATGIAQKVYIRGFEDPLLNVTVDGATQAGVLFHHSGRLAVEPELLKQVEVETGAGRATSGAGALGGAIRFVTRDPDDLLRDGERAGALVKLGSFSNSDGYSASGTGFGRLSDRWSVLASASQSDHEPFDDGNGDRVAGTDARQQLGLVKLVGNLPGEQTLRLSHEVRTDEGERPQRPQWMASGFNRLYELDGRRDSSVVNYGYAPASNPWIELNATFYHTESDIEQNVADRWGRYFGFTRSTGGDLRNTSLIGNHRLTYGVDYREDRVNAGYGGDRKAEEESGRVLGVYLQGDVSLSRHLLLSAGARYDDYRLTDNNDQRFSENAVSPNVNLAWEVVEGLTLRAGHARAFRGPSTHDTFKLESAQNDPELRGEKARNTEVGFDYRYKLFSLSAEVYRSDIRNAIADPLFGPVIYQNIGDLSSDGYLIAAGYRWRGLQAGLSFHHNEADVDGRPLTVYEHNLLGNSMGDTWVADLSYRWNSALEFGWQGRFVEGIGSLETSVGSIDKPGYGVHDIFVHWLPTGNEDIRVTLAVRNLADKQYLDHASNADYQHIEDFEGIVGMPEPGRDIRLGLALRF